MENYDHEVEENIPLTDRVVQHIEKIRDEALRERRRIDEAYQRRINDVLLAASASMDVPEDYVFDLENMVFKPAKNGT